MLFNKATYDIFKLIYCTAMSVTIFFSIYAHKSKAVKWKQSLLNVYINKTEFPVSHFYKGRAKSKIVQFVAKLAY